MATDNSSTLVRRSTKRSSHENDVTEWENMLPFYDSLPSGQTTQLPSDRPVKRYRASVNGSDKQKPAVKVLPDCSNTEQVTAQYRQIFSSSLQTDFSSIAETWVELIEPDKKHIHPYSGGYDAKPNWWPTAVRHKSPHHLWKDERVSLLIHILRMSGKGKITCTKLQAAAAQKAAADKVKKRTLKKLEETIAIRKEEEKQCDHDGIAATGGPYKEPNYGVIQLSGPASDEGRGSPSVGSPEDQIEEVTPTSPSLKSSPGFTPSSYPSTSEAPANTMYYHGSSEDQIEEISPISPVKSLPGFTPNPYPSVSEAPPNPIYYHESQYQEPYPVSQSINFRASITKAPPTTVHTNKQQQVLRHLSWPYLNNPSSECTMRSQQSTQPIQLAYHSYRSYHYMTQHNSFDLVNSTAPNPSSYQQTLLSYQQTLPSDPASHAHATSYSLPHQQWPNENNNDNNNWISFPEFWNY